MNIACPDFKPKEFGGLFQPFGFGALLGLRGTLLGLGGFGKMKTKARRPWRVTFEGSLGSREGLVKGCITGASIISGVGFGKMKTKARRPLRVPFEGSLGSREGLVKGCTTGGHNNIWCRLLQAIAVPLVESLFKGSAKGSPYTHLDCEKARCCQCLETRQFAVFFC